MSHLLSAIFIIAGLSGLAGGYQFGKYKTTTEFLSVQNSDLRESRKETERQIAQVTKAQNEYHAQLEIIAASERRYLDTNRLRQQAERAARIANANVKTCREYATTVTDLFTECRTAVVELGHEAARSRAAVDALIGK